MFSFLKSLLSTKDETFIRRWAKEAKNRAKTSSNPDLNVVFGAIVFAIADYMDTNDLKPFLKYGAVSKESLAILQSDRALFFMSCYVMAMLKLWSNKEKKPPKDAETLYANFVYLFSKSFDLHIPAYPDSESGFIRTRYRQHPDSNPEASGHLSGDLIVL